MVYVYQGRALPKPGMEKMVEGAMQAFTDWVATQPGLLHIHALKDRTTGEFVGISFWRSKEDCDRMWTAAAESPSAREHSKALATATRGPMESHEYEVFREHDAE